MQFTVVGVVTQFDVKIAEIIEQKNSIAFVAIRENVASEVERIELLIGREVGEIDGLHGQTGLTSEISKKPTPRQTSSPTLYNTTKTV